jgi:hypothetical protein
MLNKWFSGNEGSIESHETIAEYIWIDGSG